MTAPAGTYNEVDAVEGFDNFEMTDEAARRFGPANRVFTPGGLSSATLHTPKGPATLNLPAPVPTLAQFRSLEQAVNTNNQQVAAQLAQLRQLIASRPAQQGLGMMPLLIGIMAKNRFDTHVHAANNEPPSASANGDSSFSLILPLLLLQPGLLGSITGSTRPTASGQDAISPLLMAFVLTKFLNFR